MAAGVWGPYTRVHEPHMHGWENTCLLLRVVVDPCARNICTHVYPVVHAPHLHNPNYSSRSISYSPQFWSPSCNPHFLALHGADVEPIVEFWQSAGVLLVVLIIAVHCNIEKGLMRKHAPLNRGFNIHPSTEGSTSIPHPRVQHPPPNRGSMLCKLSCVY